MKKILLIFSVLFLLFSFRTDNVQKFIKASNIEKIASNTEKKAQNQGTVADDITILNNSQGSVVADLSVSASGGVSYSIPIAVAPGLNGVNPEISLDFNSQSGNGKAGWGWNVSGISVITRIPSTQFHDDKIDPVDFELDDRFALDGQRLIIKSGTYGIAGSVYQTEQYSNLKVVAYGSNPDQISQPLGQTKPIQGPEYFKVFYPDGSIAHYGSTVDSRGAMDYAISYWENPQGVRISYEYTFNLLDNYEGGRTLAIKQINYGSLGEDNPINNISFSYEAREREERAYNAGVRSINGTRLSRISIKNNSNPYRTYDLEYNQTNLGYDRLESVKVRPKNSSLTREVSFNYGNMGFQPLMVPHEASQLSLSDIEQRNAEIVTLDFTGNGQSDMIVYPKTGTDSKKKFWLFKDILNPEGFSYLPNETNTGLFETILPVNWLNSQNKLMPSQALAVIQLGTSYTVDFNIMVQSAVSAGSLPGTTYSKSWDAPISSINDSSGNPHRIPQEYISGDFDGDGLSDVIAISTSKEVITGYSAVSGPQTTIIGSIPTVNFVKLDRRLTNNFTYNVGTLTSRAKDTDRYFALEMNGDGKTDIVRFTDGGKVEVYALNDTNTAIELLWERTDSRIQSYFPIYPGDYNGDGLGDFMMPLGDDSYEFLSFLSMGNDFLAPQTTQQFKYLNTDFDGGNSTGILYGYNLIPVDFNGDSKTDIISYNTITGNNSSNGTQIISLYNNTGETTQIFEYISGSLQSYNGYLKHYPIPIFLKPEEPNNSLAFASISDKWVSSFTFASDHKEDVTLKSVSNNGITTSIKYDRVDTNYTDDDDFNFIKAYSELSGGPTDIFPFVNVNAAPAFKVVRELEQTGSGITRKRQFYYEGAVSNVNGLGFMGFKTVKSSSWFGTNAPPIWTISKYDPLLRGAQTERIIANTSSSNPNDYQSKVNYFYDYELIANPGSESAPEYDPFLVRSSAVTSAQNDVAEQYILLQNGFSANGNYSAKILSPNEQPGAAGYAGAVDIRLNRLETDNGQTGVATTETYTYDIYNNPLTTTTTYPGGNRTVTNTYSNNANAVNNTYHIGKLLKMNESLTLSGSSFSTEEQYTYNNNQVTKIRRKGNGTDWITQDIAYDNYGNIKTKTLTANGVDPRIEEFEYSATYGHRFLTKSIGIDDLETTFAYDPISGSLISSIDAFGLATAYGHDIWDRITTETDYLGNTTNYTTEYQSDGGTKTTVNYPQGSKEETLYNAFGWELKSGILSLNNQWSYTSYEYDASGRQIRQSEPHNGSPGQWNVTNFDDYGRPISQQLHTGRNTTITYTGLSTTVNDGTKSTTTTLDALGNTIKSQDPGGNVDFTYHASGQLKTANYDGHVVSVGVDGWGRKISLTDPSAGTYNYSYDNFGQLLTQSGPNGTTTYGYDSYGRPTSKQTLGTNTDMVLTYSYYDETKGKQIKKITGTDNKNNGRSYSYDYDYDSYKRATTIKENTGLANYEYGITYESTYGRVQKETYITNLTGGPSKTLTTRNVYDSSGMLKEIWNDGTPDKLWEINQINARGQALSVTLGNGIVKNKEYDSYGYLTKIEEKETGTNPLVALHTEYDFDTQRGTLKSRDNFGFNWQENFGYDNLDRLTTITGSIVKTMAYDSRGRIDSNTDLGDYSYANTAKKFQLTEIDPNALGETYFQAHPTQQITYNAFKKPVTIHEAGHGRVDFEYGPMMNRSTAYYGGEDEDKQLRKYTKHYSSIIPVEIVKDLQTGKEKIITYIAGDAYSAPIAHIKTTGTGAIDEYHYLHRDYLGSILAITDADGDVKEELQFGAWGTVDKFLDSAGNTTFGHESLLGRGYTGHEHFFEVSLIHMNGRMYDPQLGRFLSPDNYIQDPFNTQNYNRYGYVLNNPLMYNDPSGEFVEPISAIIIIGYAIFGAAAAVGAYALVKNLFFNDFSQSSSANTAPTPSNNQNNSQSTSSMSGSGRRPAFSDGGGGPTALNIPAVDTSGNIINYTLGNNFSFQNANPVGISSTGRADHLQGVARPEGWEYNPTADAQQFNKPVSEGFNITTEDVIDTALDFIPIVGGVKDIYKGIQEGSGWMVALGVGSIILDVGTLGGASLAKGAIKTGIKAGGRSLAKRTAISTTKTARKFWTKSKTFKGKKVFQRDDLIDPNLVDGAGRSNLERMKKGLSPLGSDGKSINLHHIGQQNNSAVAEILQTFHKTNHSTIHINPNTISSGINRSQFNSWRRKYWIDRANDF
jgi:RHS repeat-associated protein